MNGIMNKVTTDVIPLVIVMDKESVPMMDGVMVPPDTPTTIVPSQMKVTMLSMMKVTITVNMLLSTVNVITKENLLKSTTKLNVYHSHQDPYVSQEVKKLPSMTCVNSKDKLPLSKDPSLVLNLSISNSYSHTVLP